MSTVIVNTLTGTTTAGSISVTGEGNSTTTNLQQGLCKHWVLLGSSGNSTTGGNAHYNFTVENQDTRVRSTTSLRTYILNSQSGEGANDAIDSSVTFFGDLA